MPSSELIRWSAWAGMLGGLLWALFPILTVLVSLEDTQPWTLAHLSAGAVYSLMAVISLLLMLGLVGLRALHRQSHGRLGNIGFLSFAALALMFLGNDLEIATLTTMGSENETSVGHSMFELGFLVLLVGSVLLGVAIVRTQHDLSSRIGGLLLIAALPLGIVLAVVLGAIAPRTDLGFWAAITVPYGVAWLLLGYGLLSARGMAAEQSSHVS